MFKKLFVAVLAFPAAVLAAEGFMDQRPVMCGTPEKVIDLIKKFEERPLLGGVTAIPDMSGAVRASATFVMYVNPTTGTFTVVEYLTRKYACLIGTGNQLNFDAKDIENKQRIWMEQLPGPTT